MREPTTRTARGGAWIAAAALAFALGGAANARAQKPPATNPTASASPAAPGAGSSAALSSESGSALARASARYSDGSAHRAPFVQIYTPAGFTTARRESGTIWIQSPQRLRFDYDAPEKKTFTYDAGEGRLFTPDDKQLTIQKLSPEDRARLPIVFLSNPADLGREYAVSAESGENGATRVLLKPKSPKPELAWLRLSITRDGDLSELSYEDASGNRTEFRFEGWLTKKPRPADDYRVTGPKGTRIVEN